MARRPILLAAALCVGCVALAQNNTAESQLAAQMNDPQKQTLFQLVNKERVERGLQPLALDAELCAAAQKHSELMAGRQILSHQLSDEPEMVARVAAEGARFSAVAENVADSDSVPHAHQQWMLSPGHRDNILNGRYNAIGIGIAPARDGQLYLTEDFSSRTPEILPQQIEESVLAELNRIRSARRLTPLERSPLPMLREDACRQEVSVHKLSQTVSSAGWVTTFSSSDVSVLPDPIKKIAEKSDARSVALGACYPQADRGGFTQFRVIAIFFRTSLH